MFPGGPTIPVLTLRPRAQRARTWLLMDKEVACKLAGFDPTEDHRS